MTAMPIHRSVRREIARFLSGSDPRCGHDDHALIASGYACQSCHRELADYLAVAPEWWP